MDIRDIELIIQQQIEDILKEQGQEIAVEKSTVLYGTGGVLDSLMLMRLVVEVEEAIYEQTGHRLTLTSAQAFSVRRSPFASVGDFARFVWELFKAIEHE